MTETVRKIIEKPKYKTREIELISNILIGINDNIRQATKSLKNTRKSIKALTKDRDSFHKILATLKEGS